MLKTTALFRRVILLFFISVLLVTFGVKLAPTAYAATLDVGCGDANALINAITMANSNGEADTINLADDCTYTLTAINNSTDGDNGLPAITSEMTINGNGAIIERSMTGGTPDFRIFYVASGGTLRLNELTIANGRATADGNGVAGGGIFNLGTVELINSTVRDNFATGGGGIANELGILNLTNSTISNNIAINQGGGIYNEDGDVILTNSTVSDNTVNGEGLGGGIANAATIYDAYVTLNNSTINDNHHNSGSPYSSGGLWNFPLELAGQPTIFMKNSLIAGNDAPNCYTLPIPNYLVSQGHNLAGDDTCDLTEATDQPNTAPLLGALADNGGSTHTHALLPGSPAIDAADNTACPATDQRGIDRPFDGDNDETDTCDIGAYELSTNLRDLSISKSVIPQQAIPGTPVTYTLAFAYTGDTIATGVVITDIIPLSVTVQSVTSSGLAITDTGTSPGFVWQAQDMAPGQQGMITITTVLNEALLPGDFFTNTASISSEVADETNTGNNHSQVPLTVITANAPTFTSIPVTNATVDIPYAYAVTAVDADGSDGLTLTAPTLPTWLSLTDNGDGSGNLSGTPTSAEEGVHSVVLEVTDTTGLTDTQAFSVEVFPAGNGLTLPDPTFTDSGQSLGNAFSQAVALGDFDQDGDLDAIVANNGPNTVWRNDGHGFFTEVAELGDNLSRDIALSDLDGDGDLDIFVANIDTGGAANTVWRNDGNFTFTLMASLGNAESHGVALGDLDGDGDLDAFVANNSMAQGMANTVWQNNGNFNFTEEATLGNAGSFAVALGDLDGDGDLDAFVANAGTGQEANTVWRNNGSFSFTKMADLGDLSSKSVVLGDLDGDDDLDVFVANNNEHPNTVWRNDGDFNFTKMADLGTSFSESVALGDLDGDGDLDVFIGDASTHGNKVWRNNSGFSFTLIETLGGLDTYGVALGDLDGDGDLDAFAANSFNEANKVWFSDGGGPFMPALDVGDEASWAVALGDLDGDGDLDAFVADNGGDKLWRNNGQANFQEIATLGDSGSSTVALGDLDGDNDLDAFVGDSDGADIWQNQGGFSFTMLSTLITAATRDIALGDLDGDNDLDVLTTSGLWRNEGSLNFTPMASLGNAESWAVTLGDLDKDGDLDAFIANSGTFGGPNTLWRNDGDFIFTQVASLGDSESRAVALGDIDGDGDLDAFVANCCPQPNKVWRNEGDFSFIEAASLGDSESRAVALGDIDGDGDLDAFVGNSGVFGGPNTVWRNGGDFDFIELANLDNAYTQAVALGDLDKDGDLDAFVGNGVDSTAVNHLYLGKVGGLTRFQVAFNGPGPTPDANFYSTPVILDDSPIAISYKLFHPAERPLGRVAGFYSLNGGGQWFPATPATGTELTNLTAAPWPVGVGHTFLWDAEKDVIKSDNVLFRLETYPSFTIPGPYMWPYAAAHSFPFRVEGTEWYAKIVDTAGSPIQNAHVYQNGQRLTTPQDTPAQSNSAGLIRLDNSTPDQPLVALHQIGEQPTGRAGHDGWAYRTYLTNLDLSADGVPQPFRVTDTSGEQRLVVREENPLILFNIVASVEWDATDDYLTMLEEAFANASAYLYDVTDGQMAFGQVTIYDKGQNWAGADFQFSTKNTVRPYAFVGGILSADEAHTIRVGRFWDGGSGNQGDWNEPRGYRTLIHEFGHYALFLEDAYFMRQVDGNGNFTGQIDAFCTEESIADDDNGSDNTNATMMFYQYNATELSDKEHNWSDNCEFTEQYRLNAQADWETIVEHYPQLKTPTARGGLMAGPSDFPGHLLPFPTLTVNNSGKTGAASVQLTVRDPQGRAVPNTLVALYTIVDQVTVAIDQGLTDQQGRIDIYGASEGDTLRAATIDGSLAGAVGIGNDSNYQLELASTGAGSLLAQAGSAPHLNLIPGTDGDSLTMRVVEAPAGSLPLDAVVIPNEAAGTPQQTSLAYAPGLEAYSGQVSFAGVGLGTGRVRVSGQALPSAINSDYNLQVTDITTKTHLYAEDGNFELIIPAGGIPTDGYATVVPTGYVPGPLPAGVQVIGSAYEVRLSGALVELEKEGLVRLHYHPQVMGEHTDIAIHYWDASTKAWQLLGGVPSEVDNAYAVAAKRLGIYALMGTAVEFPYGVYLPLIVK